MEIQSIVKHAIMISFFVFTMMLLIDFIDMASKKRISEMIKGGHWRQYTLAALLGSTPGCLGAFMNVSLYVHGMISFGAVVGGMIATSGDEAFVMLVQFPGTALLLFVLLFVAGIVFAWLSDQLNRFFGMASGAKCIESDCERCITGFDNREKSNGLFKPVNLIVHIRSISFTRFLLLMLIGSFLVLIVTGALGPAGWGWKRITFTGLAICSCCIAFVASKHYLHDHVWNHLLKQHIFRVFLWSLGALFVVHRGIDGLHLNTFVHHHPLIVLLISALLGVIPESGPHLVVVMMYAQGLVPFSVLFTSSFVQDGHGMLPLLSYSLKDSMLIKALNLIFGLTVGGILFFLGF